MAIRKVIERATNNLFTNTEIGGTEAAKMPVGTTAQRANAQGGDIRFNSTISLMEYYDGTGWKAIDSAPSITSISPTTETDANADITITGQFFASGATVKFVGNDGTEYNSPSVTFNSASEIVAQTPSTALTVANEPYDIQVTNPSGLSNTLENALDAGGSPSWTTGSAPANTLGTDYEGISVSFSVAATDPDGQTVTYSLKSGSSLPSGLSLNSSTGAITGTLGTVSGDTTTQFTLIASDGVNETERLFQIVTSDDLVANFTTISQYDGDSANDSVGSNNLSLNGITANYTTNLSTITDGGIWEGGQVFYLADGDQCGDWNGLSNSLPTSGGVTIAFWGKVLGTSSQPRSWDFYNRTNHYLDFSSTNSYSQLNMNNNSGIDFRSITGDSSWSFLDWHFMCFRYSVSPVSTSSQNIVISTDDGTGIIHHSGNFSATMGSNSGTAGFMGFNRINDVYTWEGYTGGWRVFHENISDAAVVQLYNSGKGFFN
mgnify:CR=1 FL=1